MGRFSSWMNNAATDFEGWSRPLLRLFRPGVATGMAVSQRAAGANMSVDVAIGDVFPQGATNGAWDWTTAVENVAIGAASVTNRRDIVVAYTDLAVTNPSTATPNNPGALKFMVVQGTPASSPSDPSDATIQAAVGASNPFEKLARVSLTSSTSQITNAQITDLRRLMALNVQRLWGGSSNTLGHLVPNQADGTVVMTTDTNSVGAAMLATSAITLGYVESTTNFNTSSTSAVQITGLTATVTIPAGSRKILIEGYLPSVVSTGSAMTATVEIWDGTVGSGTKLAHSEHTSSAAGDRDHVIVRAVVTPSAGTKTYNLAMKVDTQGAYTGAGANSPMSLLVTAI